MGHTITSRESYPQLAAEKGARSTLGDTPDGKTITTISPARTRGGDHHGPAVQGCAAGAPTRLQPKRFRASLRYSARTEAIDAPLTLNLIIHLSKNTDLALRLDLNRRHPLSRMTTFNIKWKVGDESALRRRLPWALPACSGCPDGAGRGRADVSPRVAPRVVLSIDPLERR